MWQLLSAEGPDCSLVIPTIAKLDTEGVCVYSITSSDVVSSMARSSCVWKCRGNEDEEVILFFISCTFSHFAPIYIYSVQNTTKHCQELFSF